ncbi:MAG TPA: methyltransferase domain-containing protein [Acidimicrobiia bacterium]
MSQQSTSDREATPVTDADRGQVAATAAEVYESFFLPALFDQWAGPLLDAAQVSSGDRVLDVGCGTGIVARSALSRVGPEGRVVGLDPNEGMLAVAKKTSGVEWTTGVAEDIPFDDNGFDVVVSQFAMMFFDDRSGAVSEMSRVLEPGGRTAIATWASLDDTPGYASMVRLLDRLFGTDAGDALRAPYNMGDSRILEELLSAEFEDVEIETIEGTARFDSIEAWVHTDIRGWTLSDMSEEDYQRLLAAAEDELARYVGDGGKVSFPAPALIATGAAAG